MSDDLIKEKFNEHQKQLSDHETRLDKLEENTRILETMNYRVGNIEKSIEKIDSKLDTNTNDKSKKWDKLIDYIFYFVLALLLGYIARNLGLK